MTQPTDERLTPAAIALRLAESAERIGDPQDSPNYERITCAEIVEHLTQDPPNVCAAAEAALDGVGHAYLPGFTETRAEATLCAAIAEILRPALAAQPARSTGSSVPVAMALLGAVSDALMVAVASGKLDAIANARKMGTIAINVAWSISNAPTEEIEDEELSPEIVPLVDAVEGLRRYLASID